MYKFNSSDMKNWLIVSMFSFTLLLTANCSAFESEDEEKMSATADSFATHYFNYRFVEAVPYCLPESRKWLNFAATNMTEADIEVLKGMENGATCEPNDVDWESDSTAKIQYTVYNGMITDTLGKAGYIADKANYTLSLVKRQGKWWVKMEGLLRNEKQSRG